LLKRRHRRKTERDYTRDVVGFFVVAFCGQRHRVDEFSFRRDSVVVVVVVFVAPDDSIAV
jgi:hypothetical protein